ncbi:MAG TPA: heparinase II/III family protein, partial [Candidatus Hydrogenedentes bacterium]|nr:heparinase II/III family protein [Candidatus Hydrogenedentota bacterium]
DHGVALLVASSQALPIGQPPLSTSYMDGVGSMMRGLAMGYDAFGKSMSAEQRAIVEDAGRAYLAYLLAEAATPRQWWVPYHNYMGCAFGGGGLLALSLTDAYPDASAAWLKNCTEELTRWFGLAFDAQGAYCEGTSYTEYGLRNAVLFMHALKSNGGPDLFQHPHLRMVPQFFALSLLPGEKVFDARNDAYYKGLSDPLWLRIAEGQQSGLARWLWDTCGTRGSWWEVVWHTNVSPVSPDASGLPQVRHFEGRGLVIARTGWTANDLMFSIEAGPFHRKIHNQADKGAFTLYGYGQRWAIDSGYGNTQAIDGAAQTVAHNAVLIDGKGQALSGAGLGTDGSILAFEDSTHRTYVHADATSAYQVNSDGQAGIALRHAHRHVLWVKALDGREPYCVLFDDIDVDDAEHDFVWQMHTSERMRIDADGTSATFQPEEGGVPELLAVFCSRDPMTLGTRQYNDHPVLEARVRAKRLQLVSLLFPTQEAVAAREVSAEYSATEGIALRIHFQNAVDTILWKPGTAPRLGREG